MKLLRVMAVLLIISHMWAITSCDGIVAGSPSSADGVSSAESTDVIPSDTSSPPPVSSEQTSTELTSSEITSSEQMSSEQTSSEIKSEPPVSSAESMPVSSSESSEMSTSSEESGQDDHPDDGEDKNIVLKKKLSAEQLKQFENSAFVGNSIIKGIYNYRSVPDADFYTRTSLNVQSIYTTSTDTGRVPIMDMIDTRQGAESYEKVFLLLGINEFGYSFDSFVELYGQLVEDMKVRQPDAEIYIISVFPVTREYGRNNERNITRERVLLMNDMIKTMCDEKGATYLDVHSYLANENGDLPSNLSTDGVHANRDCSNHIIASIYELVFDNVETE